MKRRIVLLGPPASGKGTQAEMIEARYQIPVASTGAILREERRKGTALGLQADKVTAGGGLVADDLIIEMVTAWIHEHREAFVLDGFPRTLVQAEALDAALAEQGAPLQVALSLEAEEAALRRRVEQRVVCTTCGHVDSVGFRVQSANDPCPNCGGQLARRRDDTLATLENRLIEYKEKTLPLIGYYEAQEILRRVNTMQSPEAAFTTVCAILEES